jgi:hypothetical protein
VRIDAEDVVILPLADQPGHGRTTSLRRAALSAADDAHAGASRLPRPVTRDAEGVDEKRTRPGGTRHGAVEELDAVGERVSVQVRILDYHDRILGKPVAGLRE